MCRETVKLDSGSSLSLSNKEGPEDFSLQDCVCALYHGVLTKHTSSALRYSSNPSQIKSYE